MPSRQGASASGSTVLKINCWYATTSLARSWQRNHQLLHLPCHASSAKWQHGLPETHHALKWFAYLQQEPRCSLLPVTLLLQLPLDVLGREWLRQATCYLLSLVSTAQHTWHGPARPRRTIK